MKLVGGAVLALGIFLFFGNIFSFFPTFPMAGWLTIAVGSWLYGKS